MTNSEFEKLFKQYHEFSVRVANKVVRNLDDAEEIAQNAFINLYRMGEKLDFSEEAKVRGLIRTVTVNAAIDFCRRSYRRHEEAMGESETVWEIPGKESVEELIIGMEASEYAAQIFRRLFIKDRLNYEIFVAVKICDLSPERAAEIFEMSVNSINNRVMRTKRWLLNEYRKLDKE